MKALLFLGEWLLCHLPCGFLLGYSFSIVIWIIFTKIWHKQHLFTLIRILNLCDLLCMVAILVVCFMSQWIVSQRQGFYSKRAAFKAIWNRSFFFGNTSWKLENFIKNKYKLNPLRWTETKKNWNKIKHL
jgi:hypothetical protein